MKLPWPAVGVTALVSFLAGGFLVRGAARRMQRWQKSRRLSKGIKAEAQGEKILRRFGYQILEVQPSRRVGMHVDGSWKEYEIRPDALAAKSGRTYYVEIKSGSVAVSPTFRETRRQLLEYHQMLPCDGVLLVNVGQGIVQEIAFGQPKAVKARIGWWATLFVLGVIVGLLCG